jgi:hypothetical protein
VAWYCDKHSDNSTLPYQDPRVYEMVHSRHKLERISPNFSNIHSEGKEKQMKMCTVQM